MTDISYGNFIFFISLADIFDQYYCKNKHIYAIEYKDLQTCKLTLEVQSIHLYIK